MAFALVNSEPTTTQQQQQQQNPLLFEKIQLHFKHFQFFFDSSHIQQLSRSDRRFLQRIYREKAHFNVDAFYSIDCEDEVPEKFHEIYNAILETNGSANRTYQLIVNTLTFYYSRLTWATCVQKYVLKFLADSLLNNFHESSAENGQRSLFELELVCLLALFVLRYSFAVVPTSADAFDHRSNEDMVVQLLFNIREKGGEEYLIAFISGPILNHFGCSLDLRLRRIVERLDIKVKIFRDMPPFSLSSAGVGRGRKLSLNTAESTGRSDRCGSSGKGTSSEPVASDASTENGNMEAEEGEKETKETVAKVGIGRHRKGRQQQQDTSAVDICVKEEEKEDEQRTPSPMAKHLRSGSNASVLSKKRGGSNAAGRKPNKVLVNNSRVEEFTRRSSSCSNGAATAPAAECCTPTPSSLVSTTPNFPITRSVTAHASAANSSRSSSSTNTTATCNNNNASSRTTTRQRAVAIGSTTKIFPKIEAKATKVKEDEEEEEERQWPNSGDDGKCLFYALII